jgi:hypothetical protein
LRSVPTTAPKDDGTSTEICAGDQPCTIGHLIPPPGRFVHSLCPELPGPCSCFSERCKELGLLCRPSLPRTCNLRDPFEISGQVCPCAIDFCPKATMPPSPKQGTSMPPAFQCVPPALSGAVPYLSRMLTAAAGLHTARTGSG